MKVLFFLLCSLLFTGFESLSDNSRSDWYLCSNKYAKVEIFKQRSDNWQTRMTVKEKLSGKVRSSLARLSSGPNGMIVETGYYRLEILDHYDDGEADGIPSVIARLSSSHLNTTIVCKFYGW